MELERLGRELEVAQRQAEEAEAKLAELLQREAERPRRGGSNMVVRTPSR